MLKGSRARLDAAPADAALARIQRALAQIVDPASVEDKVVIFVEGREELYVQFAGAIAGDFVYGEAVSNAFLTGAERLSADQVNRLVSDGWEAPDGKDFLNFHREWEIRDARDLRLISLETMRVLEDVYGVHDLDRLTIDVFD
jgi:hypothetical protein